MWMKAKTRFGQLARHHLSEEKSSLILALLCTAGIALADVLRPWPLKIIFDYVLLAKPLPGYLRFLQPVFARGEVWAVVIISLCIPIISGWKGVCAYSQLHLTSRAGYHLIHALRRELFAHLQRLSLSFHTRSQSGELLTKVTTDTNNLRDMFGETGLQLVADSLTLLGMVLVMLTLNWKLSLIVLATFPPLAALSMYRYKTIRDAARRQRRAEGQIATRVSEVLGSIQTVQAFGREDYEEERFEAESAQTVKEGMRTARMEAAAARGVELISALGSWAVILVGSFQVLKGRMTPGNVLVFAAYMTSLYSPIRSLAKLSARFSRAAVSAQRIGEILESRPEVEDSPGAVEAPRLRGEIEFRDVWFDYGDGNDVLRGISLRIPAGSKVALLGRSGSGKSTLGSLLLRFYNPQDGTICMDGREIREYKSESLRRQIGIVLQDSILFGATIRENIAYGKPNASDAEILAAARAANAHEFIERLENGYDTVVQERGANLSGGQRQRIAIARTFIRNTPILILDEPMTGLDVESEGLVCDALQRLMAGKTSLLITHDLQAAADADHIVLLEGGRIVEAGSHSDLFARSNRYRQLHSVRPERAANQAAAVEVLS